MRDLILNQLVSSEDRVIDIKHISSCPEYGLRKTSNNQQCTQSFVQTPVVEEQKNHKISFCTCPFSNGSTLDYAALMDSYIKIHYTL